MKNCPVVLVYFISYLNGTRAFPGSTTAGSSFSVAHPNSGLSCGGTTITLHVTTMEIRAQVIVIDPWNSVLTTKEVTVERFKQVSVVLNGTLAFVENRVYSTVEVESDNPIMIIAVMSCSKMDSMVMLVVMPCEYYKYEYIVTTGIGYPFMIVLTSYLSPRPSIIRVKFTSQGPLFSNVKCNLNALCSTNSTLDLSIHGGKCWFFKLEKEFGDLHGTKVTSHSPIHVLSGNLKLRTRSLTSNDLQMSASISPRSWGKYYFVPNFDDTTHLLVRFHILGNEMKCNVYPIDQPTKEILIKASYEKRNLDQAYVSIDAHKMHIMLEAEKPFGVILFGRVNDAIFMESLVPKSLWTSYSVYLNMEEGIKQKMLLISDIADEVFGQSIKVSSWSYMGKNKELVVTDLPASQKNTVYLKGYRRRLMLFVLILRNISVSGCQVTYFTSSINHQKWVCEKTDPVLGDGIDNDCDGRVDEEVINRIDDDSDGRVDEDIAQRFQDGAWSRWKLDCTTRCGELDLSKQYRTCDNPYPSLFGKRCQGRHEKCSPSSASGSDCPKMCGQQVFSSLCKSECPASCVCAKNGSCLHCKRGYFTNTRCTVKCPNGWDGFGCNGLVREMDFMAGRLTNETPMWSIVLISLTPVFFLCLLAFVLGMYARPECRKKIFRI